jgi:hypothetical protein
MYKYNHKILANNARFTTKFLKFNQSILVAEIEHAVVYGRCDAYTIRNLLQLLFPEQLFFTQDLSNAIQKIKRDKRVIGSKALNGSVWCSFFPIRVGTKTE